MKMAYETPKMKVEGFRTDAYCAACGNQPYFTGWLSVMYNGVTNWFFGDNKIKMLNQNTREEQYYYRQVERKQDADGNYYAEAMTGNILYLEYSAPYDTFVLYREAGEDSGYYVNQNADYDGERDGFISGANSLQVNTGDKETDPWFQKEAGMATIELGNFSYNPSTSFYKMNGSGNPVETDGRYTTVNASKWYADECLGATKYTQEQGFEMIPS